MSLDDIEDLERVESNNEIQANVVARSTQIFPTPCSIEAMFKGATEQLYLNLHK